MATRVYKIAVVGCPRSVLSPEGFYDGVGKSCLCNRFIRAEAYNEDHRQESSELSEDEWTSNPVFNGDHFIYWGAANKHLSDKTKVRFQVVEHTEFYKAKSATKLRTSSEDEEDSYSEDDEEDSRNESKDDCSELPFRLNLHLPTTDYVARSCAIHFRSRRQGKMAYRLKALEEAVKKSIGPIRATTQLFPNEDFGGKKTVGIYGFICIFDPTLDGEPMLRQLNFLSELLRALVKTKRKVVIACVKCDMVEDHKIRFGSKLSTYALKKCIPFFEVSARDSVNVDDVFFSLVPSKMKNARRSSSNNTGYREVIDSRRGDLNRAKDAFRKMLQDKITDFSFKWSETLLFLEADYTYQSVKNLLGDEADEVLLKMFQLRLIEIKLKEATKQFGNSLAKKADKVRSHQYQVYLKKAFSGHPDLMTDSTYKEYIPELSESDEMDILTDPSTPSSYSRTPDLSDVHPFRHRSSTISDIQSNQDSPGFSLVRSIDDITSVREGTSSMVDRHFKFSTAPSITGSAGDIPPPLPARDTAILNRRKTITTMSLSSSNNPRNMSVSMDHLSFHDDPDSHLKSNDSAHLDFLDAEPYLKPMDVMKVMGQSLGHSMRLKDNQYRNNPGFMSMRLSKITPTLIPVNTSLEKNRDVLMNRTHRRSHSNPFVLASVGDFVPSPPHLPHRHFDSVSSQGTPKHRMSNPPNFVESLDSCSSKTIVDPLWKPSNKPLPSIPDNSSIEHSVTRNKILISKSTDFEGDGDNLSQISGPFEDMDNMGKRVKESKHSASRSLPDLIGVSSSLPVGLLPPTSNHHRGGSISIEDDQYAEIEEFQQYMQMTSAPLNVDKSKTLPSSQVQQDTQEEDTAVPLLPTRRVQAKSISSMSISPQHPGKGARRDTMSMVASAPLISTLKKRLMKLPRNEPSIPEESKDGGFLLPSKLTKYATMTSIPVVAQSSPVTHDIRPLPPSPAKAALRKSSNHVAQKTDGSNIYEVIDEAFVNGLTNRPGSKSSHRDSPVEWEPPVGRSLWPKYLEVMHTFFNLPQIQELWLDTVKSIMVDVDPEDICPPYFNASVKMISAAESLKDVREKSGHKQEGTEEEGRPESSSPLDTDTKLVKVHGIPPPTNTPDNGIIPINLPPPIVPPHRNKTPDGASPTSKGWDPQQQQLQAPSPSATSQGNSKLSVNSQGNSKLSATSQGNSKLSVNSQGNSKLSTNSDQLIMMLNQSQHYDSDDEISSSDADDSDLDDVDSKSSSDSDFSYSMGSHLKLTPSRELVTSDLLTTTRSMPLPHLLPKPGQKRNIPPKPKPKPSPQKPRSIIVTRELRAMDSNDSDSAFAKSPLSTNVGDFDMNHMMSEDGEVHNVKPSQMFKNRTTYRLTSPKATSKMRGDSGTFEEEDSLPHTHSTVHHPSSS